MLLSESPNPKDLNGAVGARFKSTVLRSIFGAVDKHFLSEKEVVENPYIRYLESDQILLYRRF
jgi:hypothetical protein